MIKRLLIGLVLVFGVVLLLGYVYLGSAAKAGIEYAGEFALKTDVRVDSVTLSPLNGNGAISGLTIANPEGFSDANAFALGAIEVQLSVPSVFEELVVIDLVRIAQPQITYETTLSRDNLRTLIANLPSSGQGAASSESSAGPAKQLVIRRFEILGPQLTVVSALGSAPVTLPDIILSDIGGPSGGVSVAEAAGTVLRELIASIGAAQLPSVDQLRERVEQRAREEVERLEEEVTNRVEEALGTSTEELGNRLRGLGI